jgi:hypothetical protein
MFDLFDFTPVDGDPFRRNGAPTPAPARPYSPTPFSGDDLRNALYGADLPSPMQPYAPLPSWVPPNVQNYINQAPSYNEGERQPPTPPIMLGPISPTPQIDDIQRLFHNRIMQNAPTNQGFSAEQYRNLMKLPGFAGFAGGDEI